MTLPLHEVRNAAFWQDDICLDCGNVQTGVYSTTGRCHSCDSTNITEAQTILTHFEFVEVEGEEG